MRVMIVDDERLALRQFALETEDVPGVDVVRSRILWRPCSSSGKIRWTRPSWISRCRR